MAYDFIGLVNSVCGRMNEVPLTSSDFLSADGVYQEIRDSVNASIREINSQSYEWPFNHTTESLTLTEGVNRYSHPATTKTVDYDSFRIRFNETLDTDGGWLRVISYDEYLKRYSQEEYNSSTSIRQEPRYVFRLPTIGFGVYPIPDKEYELDYERFTIPEDLAVATDVPSLPFQFKHLIVDGGSRGAYLFRGDVEGHDRMQAKFDKGIEAMRDLYIDKVVRVTETRIRTNQGLSTLRVS